MLTFHRQHELRSSCIYTIGCPCLRCGDIAILFDVIVLDWRNLIVEFLHLLWDYIYCCYMMVLNFRKPTRPSLPLRKAFFYLSVSPARRAPLSPQAPSSSGSGDVTVLSAIFAPPVPPQREGPYPIPKP